MGIYPTLKRLLEATILSAVAGGAAYGLTVWLAPPSVSAFLVAIIVAAITALACRDAATAVLSAVGTNSDNPWSPADDLLRFRLLIDIRMKAGTTEPRLVVSQAGYPVIRGTRYVGVFPTLLASPC